ncbi:MAG: hypothetical protein H6709_22950 [Kofleriaceae bacterium]|nr:hypothetical protein [Kofleriaceae bacterium]
MRARRAGGYAAAAAATLATEAPVLHDGHLDPAALATVSRLAAAAARAADRDAVVPALPQRAGLDPATGKTVTPPVVACGGGSASLRVVVPAPP